MICTLCLLANIHIVSNPLGFQRCQSRTDHLEKLILTLEISSHCVLFLCVKLLESPEDRATLWYVRLFCEDFYCTFEGATNFTFSGLS
jgi:hypothetical protein